jgi:hypothetical protein
MLAGCTVSDALFEVFGNHYTGGGYTREEKEYHYNEQVEAHRNRARGSDAASHWRPWNP